MIVVGRPLPPPYAIEDLAAAATGWQPKRLPPGEFYPKRIEFQNCADGSHYPVEAYYHPDPLCQEFLTLICTGEVVNAIGRARGVNRTEADPVEIVYLSNVVLPLAANRVVTWKAVLAEMDEDLAEVHTRALQRGVIIRNSATYAQCLFPDLFPKPSSAKHAYAKARATGKLERTFCLRRVSFLGETSSPTFVRFRLVGQSHWVDAWFLRAIVPDPVAWLRERLGDVVVEFIDEPPGEVP